VATVAIREGSVVAEYLGSYVTPQQLKERERQYTVDGVTPATVFLEGKYVVLSCCPI
jgi:hypothetical protein